jgi:hypothetical protein
MHLETAALESLLLMRMCVDTSQVSWASKECGESKIEVPLAIEDSGVIEAVCASRELAISSTSVAIQYSG